MANYWYIFIYLYYFEVMVARNENENENANEMKRNEFEPDKNLVYIFLFYFIFSSCFQNIKVLCFLFFLLDLLSIFTQSYRKLLLFLQNQFTFLYHVFF